MSASLWSRLRSLWGDRPALAPASARTGSEGERAAESHLRASGLRILFRNWRNPADAREEIDLVCQEHEVLVFVEVKTRASGALVGGYHAVDARKKRVLVRACRAYLSALKPPARHVRFDIIEVEHGGNAAAADAARAMKLSARVFSEQAGMLVWHHRDVPLFPDRANHRHG